MKRIIVLLALVAPGQTAFAATYKDGDRVVTVRPTALTTPTIPGRTKAPEVARLDPGTVLTVERAQDGLLWVNDIQPGWVRTEDVVTPEEARIVFSGRIAHDQFRGDWYVARGNVLLELKEYNSAHRDFAEAILRKARNLSVAYIGRASAKLKRDEVAADSTVLAALAKPASSTAVPSNTSAAPSMNPPPGVTPAAPNPTTPTPAPLIPVPGATPAPGANPPPGASTPPGGHATKKRTAAAKPALLTAESDLNLAIQSDRRNTKALLTRAQVENGPKKLPYLDEAVRQNPLSALAFAARGQYFESVNNHKRACADLSEAKALDRLSMGSAGKPTSKVSK